MSEKTKNSPKHHETSLASTANTMLGCSQPGGINPESLEEATWERKLAIRDRQCKFSVTSTQIHISRTRG